MKKAIILATAISSTALLNAPAHADMSTQHKQEATVLTTAIVGAVAAGPVGWIAGALGGGWMANQIEKADQYDTAQQELASLRKLNQQLQNEKAEYAQMTLDQLQLDMLFNTADSSLSLEGKQRLQVVADFLQRNPEVEVRLDGYADPRGSEAFNMSLSSLRAHSVAEQLVSMGVADERIAVYSHGETLSTAIEGDNDAYALERRVRIELNRIGSDIDNEASLAQVEIY